MADMDAKRLTMLDGVGPQQIKHGRNEPEFIVGSDGAQHVKIVDSKGNPIYTVSTKDDAVKRAVDDVKRAIDGLPESDYTELTEKLDELKSSVEGNKIELPDVYDVKDDLVLDKLTELENQIKATNERLDGTFDTRLTGSIVEYQIDTDFIVPEEDKAEYRVKIADAFGTMPKYWGYSLYLNENTSGNPEIEIRQGTGDNSSPGFASIHELEFSRFQSIPPLVEVSGHHPFAINIYVISDTKEVSVRYLKLWGYVGG